MNNRRKKVAKSSCSGTKCVLSLLRKRQCSKILKKWQALDSAQNGHEVHKEQPNDNSKVNRTQVIHFQISTSAESIKFRSVTTEVVNKTGYYAFGVFFEKKVLLRIIFYHGIRYYSLLPLHRCKNHVFTTNLARDMK